MFVRGTGATQAFIWDESADEFALISTNDDHTVVGNVNISGYSNLRVGGLTVSQIKIADGTQGNGKYLISDANGIASWTSAPPMTSGSSGTSGTSGSSGTSGTRGTSGTSGTSGSSGLLSLTGTTDNGLITLNGTSPNATVESNLTFDGTSLYVRGELENDFVTTLSGSVSLSSYPNGGWFTLGTVSYSPGRGTVRFIVAYTGGNFTPVTYVINAYKDWGTSQTTLSLEKFGNSNHIKEVRMVKNDTSQLVYLELFLSGDDDIHEPRLYVQKLHGYNYDWYYTPSVLSPTLFPSLDSNSTDWLARAQFPVSTGGPSFERVYINSNTQGKHWNIYDGGGSASYQLQFRDSGGTLMTLDGDTNYVGIGNFSSSSFKPLSRLHVDAASGDSILSLSRTTAASSWVSEIGMVQGLNATYAVAGMSFVTGGTTQSGTIVFRTANGTASGDKAIVSNGVLERMRITPDGNVGIGDFSGVPSINPTSYLSINSGPLGTTYNGGTNALHGLMIGSPSTGGDLFIMGVDQQMDFAYMWAATRGGSAKPIVIQPEGSGVSIGTYSNSAKLHVNTWGSTTAIIASGSTTGDMVRITQTGTGNSFVVEDGANPDSTPFVINNIGNVGISTTTPSYNLHVNGTASVNSLIVGLTQSLYTSIGMNIGVGTTNIYSIATASYTSVFYDYYIKNGSNLRAGTITAVWSGNSVQFTDVSTMDIGNTTTGTNAFTFSVALSSPNAVLQGISSISGWEFRSMIRSI